MLELCILPTEFIFVFRVVVAINRDFFPKHQQADLRSVSCEVRTEFLYMNLKGYVPLC
jgi:hypothetical protein